MTRAGWRTFVAATVGGGAGFAYYLFLGCDSG